MSVFEERSVPKRVKDVLNIESLEIRTDVDMLSRNVFELNEMGWLILMRRHPERMKN
jgi:hypothetical protein